MTLSHHLTSNASRKMPRYTCQADLSRRLLIYLHNPRSLSSLPQLDLDRRLKSCVLRLFWSLFFFLLHSRSFVSELVRVVRPTMVVASLDGVSCSMLEFSWRFLRVSMAFRSAVLVSTKFLVSYSFFFFFLVPVSFVFLRQFRCVLEFCREVSTTEIY